ncbi:deoxynucleoside triphosphate triphosphohydrolase SAMHD1-like isoform X2 [Penaeus japonicus]|uniref:deoxynucleoside triphosphate triphosphohydrolase SAMHD1-like isoform X2 n=1 Tax=Penaeus japonicus TaxID=27405 RepID=UPI001C714E71|nr:deoxynucleoside triphosphate triphosphohydrolase SAMHD1-like isoform X2 [Penaeus japonicus]
MGKNKLVNDAVHGHIEIPALCVRIIDTPQFQRLRFLQQLGTASFVFPAASHSRFEHCLGTCHLAGQLVRSLHSRQEELNISEEDILCVQIAGLCHDLGHGAFSHSFEVFMRESKPSMKFKHEEISCEMFDHLLKENNIMSDFEREGLGEKDVQFIKDLIIGGAPSEANGRGAEKAFLFEVTFEYERLICFSKAAEVEGEWHIVFKETEAENLYEMNHARAMLHKKAYQHRVVMIIDRMLVDALLKADDSTEYTGGDGKRYKLSEVHRDMTAYTFLTDDVIHRILRKPTGSGRLEEAKMILNNIFKRNLYAYIGELQVDAGDGETKDELEEKFPEALCLTKRVGFGSKEGNPLEEQHFYRRGNQEAYITLRANEVSRMLPREFTDVKLYVITRDSCQAQRIRDFIESKRRRPTEDQ